MVSTTAALSQAPSSVKERRKTRMTRKRIVVTASHGWPQNASARRVEEALAPWRLSTSPSSPSVCDIAARRTSSSCVSLEAALHRDVDQSEFLQAASEVMRSLTPLLERKPHYYSLFVKMLEPERSIVFRVPWLDDDGVENVNRGFRVQFNSALGPYKGGLRFRTGVNLSELKFLALEQTLKNALTGMSLGSGKGGADFDPRGRSDAEVMRFCQSYMTELAKHIGPTRDVPAGDIGVGSREIGYLFAQYKRIVGRFDGALTGKMPGAGGSLLRPEATGYGLIYFVCCMLGHGDHGIGNRGSSDHGVGDTDDAMRLLRDARILISGSGSVALHAAAKAIELGARVLTLSDSDGCLYVPDGISRQLLDDVMHHKLIRRGRLTSLPSLTSPVRGVHYLDGQKPWAVTGCDIALPCATQNELDEVDALALIEGGCTLVAEGANMPVTPSAHALFSENGILIGPAKAANAGGVAVSGLEMAQNATFMPFSAQDVDSRLRTIMRSIHERCLVAAAEMDRPSDLVCGADVAGFRRVADAMHAQGCV